MALRGHIKGLGDHRLNQAVFIYDVVDMKSLSSFLFFKQKKAILSLKMKQAFPECTLPLRSLREKTQQEYPKVHLRVFPAHLQEINVHFFIRGLRFWGH